MDGSKGPRARVVLGVLMGLFVLALIAGPRILDRPVDPAPGAPVSGSPSSSTVSTPESQQGLISGRVTTERGTVYEGRLRWGGSQEAFWSDTFQGTKAENPWVAWVDPDRLPMEDRSIEILGFEIDRREQPVDLGRPFVSHFGDLVRIEKLRRTVRVTLKSGTVVDLDRLAAGDFDDGVRVWDSKHGVVDLGPRQIRAIELLPTPSSVTAAARLYGTVSTGQGDFTGFVQWDRDEGLGSDTLDGEIGDGEIEDSEIEDGEVRLRFDTVRSIAREERGVRITRSNGREIMLTGSAEVGEGNRGIFVEDPAWGRVRVSWEIFERLDLTWDDPTGGPAYGEFPPGQPLQGRVTYQGGRELVGRLVFDLDENETTDTLDAPNRGLNYTIPMGRIARIVPASEGSQARVTLWNGREIELEAAGDLGAGNAGLLVFVTEGQAPEYLPWAEVERIDFERAPAVSPPSSDSDP